MPRKKSGVPKQSPPKGLIVATHLPKDAQSLYLHCLMSWAAVKKDVAHFPTPLPSGTELDADSTALGNALEAAEGGGPTALAAVKAAAKKVRQDHGLLAKYVQSALRSVPIEDTPPILAAILMYASNIGKRGPKPPFEVVQPKGMPSGTVHAIALAVVSAQIYHWEASLDQLSWVVTTTSKANALLLGLTPGKMYYFRFRACVRGGTMTDYSQVVTLIAR
jgi:hypothetical protein